MNLILSPGAAHFTSSVTGQNVTKLFDLALSIDATRATRISTRELNKWLVRMTDLHRPPASKTAP